MRILRTRTVSGALLLASFFAAALAVADETVLPAASAAAPIQSQGLAARPVSLGGAFVGIADDASSLYWNPAGIATSDQGDISLHHNTYLLDGSQDSLTMALPLSTGSAIGLGVDWVNYGSFTDRDANGFALGQSAADDLSLKLAMAWRLGWGLQVGMAGSYLDQTIDSYAYPSYALDLGLIWQANERWRLGLSGMGLGIQSTGERASVWRAGSSYQLGKGSDYQTLLALAASLEPGGIGGFQVGIEERLRSILALRAGYQWSADSFQVDGFSGVDLGVGVRLDGLDLDYAYVPYGNLGSSQRFSVGRSFAPSGFWDLLGFGADQGGPLVLRGSSYVGASVGGSYAVGYDSAALSASLADDGFTSSVPPDIGVSGSFWAGYQFPTGIVLELGTQIDPPRDFSFGEDLGSVKLDVSAQYLDLMFYGLGGYRWVFGRNLLTLGARLQEHMILGTVTVKETVLGIETSANGSIESDALGLGPALRWERLLGDHASLGVELGFDALLISPELDALSSDDGSVGSQSPLNYSSFYARVTLTGWFSAPVSAPPLAAPSVMPEAAAAPATATASALQLEFGIPKDWYEAGRELEEKGQAREASEAYAQAVKADPGDSRAWRALAGSYVALGQKERAVESFERYLQLVPGDDETAQWLKKFKAQAP
jgi:hypothetical protein